MLPSFFPDGKKENSAMPQIFHLICLQLSSYAMALFES